MITVVAREETGSSLAAAVLESEFAAGIRKDNGRIEVNQVRVIV